MEKDPSSKETRRDVDDSNQATHHQLGIQGMGDDDRGDDNEVLLGVQAVFQTQLMALKTI